MLYKSDTVGEIEVVNGSHVFSINSDGTKDIFKEGISSSEVNRLVSEIENKAIELQNILLSIQ